MASPKLQHELKKKGPFESPEQEVALSLLRASDQLQIRFARLFREHGLTPSQYNILRILRGAGRDGVTCSQAAERMVTADPDITRLLDRLEARGLIRRERGQADRRVVVSHITAEGSDLLNSIDEPLVESIRKLAGHIEPKKLQQLIETLEALRQI
jgi:DNA-binding MarR family transcriptional regulator